jgi:hypothetical protein
MHEVKIGFEFEFGSKLLFHDLYEAFEKESGYLLSDYIRGDYSSWSLHSDYSAYTLGTNGVKYAAELVSPPQPLNKALADLEMVLNFIKKHGATCNTSGLHIGMSFEDVSLNKKVRPLELICSIPELELLESFGRKKNSYSQSMKKVIRDLVNRHKSILYQNDKILLSRLVHKLQNYYSHGSYAIELGKMLYDWITDSNRYIEFRITGGQDYQNRFTDLYQVINIYRTAMITSLVPNNEFVQESLKTILEIPLD